MTARRFLIRLLPLLLIAALWLHARRSDDSLVVFGPRGWAQVLSCRQGTTFLSFTTVSAGPQRAWSALIHRAAPDPDRPTIAQFFGGDLIGEKADVGDWGFALTAGHVAKDEGVSGGVVYVAIPLWCWLALSAVPALFAARQWHQVMRRRRTGRCVQCGYDLRASSERCPECGTSIAVASQPSRV